MSEDARTIKIPRTPAAIFDEVLDSFDGERTQRLLDICEAMDQEQAIADHRAQVRAYREEFREAMAMQRLSEAYDAYRRQCPPQSRPLQNDTPESLAREKARMDAADNLARGEGGDR